VTVIGTVLAFGFLVGAMWALSSVDRIRGTDQITANPTINAADVERLAETFKIKLAVVTGFVALFAMWVGLLVGAKRAEIFVATATYAAVLVVYVGKG
jgi:hypothetical protein